MRFNTLSKVSFALSMLLANSIWSVPVPNDGLDQHQQNSKGLVDSKADLHFPTEEQHSPEKVHLEKRAGKRGKKKSRRKAKNAKKSKQERANQARGGDDAQRGRSKPKKMDTSKKIRPSGRTKAAVDNAIKRAKDPRRVGQNKNGQGHGRDGTVFGNRDSQLPGRSKKYLEFGIESQRSRAGKKSNDGSQFDTTNQKRLVVGGKYDKKGRFKQKGVVGYTDDHYESFKQVDKKGLRN